MNTSSASDPWPDDLPDLPDLPDIPLPGLPTPDIPGIDIPSPGDVVEGAINKLSSLMKDDSDKAINSVIESLAKQQEIDFAAAWLQHTFSLLFGVALVGAIFIAVPIIIVSSMSKSLNASQRMIHILVHSLKLFAVGYLALPVFALFFAISQLLANIFGQLHVTSDSSSNLALLDIAESSSVFGNFALNFCTMVAGGILKAELSLIQYSLVPLALFCVIAYAIKPIGMWGNRFWKLYVSLVFAALLTTPFVVLILGIADVVATKLAMTDSAASGLFLLAMLAMCACMPLSIMALAYVGYTIQVGKTEVKGTVQTMPLKQQEQLYGRQTAERVSLMSSANSNGHERNSRSSRERVMSGYIKSSAQYGVETKINAATTAIATKLAATGPQGVAAGVVVKAGGELVKRKIRN
jgi:hypothetical protein